MRILIDMDDVLERLIDGWVAYLNERFGTDVRPENVRSWNMGDNFPALTREQVYSAVDDPQLWDYVTPMPGAAEAVRRLMDRGHEIYVVTATDYPTLATKMDKVLFRYFPMFDWDHVIITRNKQMVRGDVLIDDGPHNLSGGEYRGILFESYHNRTFDETAVGAVRARNWDEVLEIITEMETERR